MGRFDRTEKLIGESGLQVLRNSRVAIFGLGGVGGYACEALVRSGIGSVDIIDDDVVDETNINRQIIALDSTVGKAKVYVMEYRIRDINPKCKVRPFQVFFSEETVGMFDFSDYDYVIDAVDSVRAKDTLIKLCDQVGTPIISSMGTGNKLDPTAFKIADIYDTKVCPLAKVMRKSVKKMGIQHLKVVYSEELPAKTGCRTPASISFVPPAAGLAIAGEVIRDIIAFNNVQISGADEKGNSVQKEIDEASKQYQK